MIPETCRLMVFGVVSGVVLLLGVGSAPATEPPFSIVALLHDPQALARPHDVEVDGGLMFVPGKGGSIAIIDVTDPARPEIMWSTRDEEDDAQTVLPHGKHLFVGTRDFLSIDISEPRQAVIRKRLGDRPRIDRINGMIMWDHHVLYANKRGWIGAIDVSRPDAPVLAGALNTREHGGIVSPHDIARYKHCVVIVDQRDMSPWKVRVYQVADRETGQLLPVEQWRPEGAVGGERLNGANRVVVRDHYALIACNKADTLAVVDLHEIGEPETIRVLPFPAEPCGLALAGNVLFAAGGQSIQAFDVSNPREPEKLSSFKNAEVFPTEFTKVAGKKRYTMKGGVRKPCRGNAHDLVYERGYLYVTAQSDDQVAILHVDDQRIRRLAEAPPAAFGGACVPVVCDNPETMTEKRRVRPQALVFNKDGGLKKILYTTDGSGPVSIATALAETEDGGATWLDHPGNPVLDRIESDWQGNRAFVTGLVRDEDNQRWVMATVGNDAGASTPGIRATGLWFSEDLVDWKQYSGNPIITVQTDGAVNNDEAFPGPRDPPVGMYLRHFQRIDGTWYALVQWRGDGTWSRMTVMQSDGDITGPWTMRNVCLDPDRATEWFNKNRNLNWCQPVRVEGRWYAACQNGVAGHDRDNDHVGIVYSDDYFHWHEFDNPVTAPLTRPDGSTVISSQQFLLPPEDGEPWRILLGARGVHDDKYMYLVYP
ncbi:MAG: hypothetical protein ACQESR_21915 [Planctomycetota bacterium]